MGSGGTDIDSECASSSGEKLSVSGESLSEASEGNESKAVATKVGNQGVRSDASWISNNSCVGEKCASEMPTGEAGIKLEAAQAAKAFAIE